MTRPLLRARVDRRDGVHVLVDLLDPSRTEFLEAGEHPPDEAVVFDLGRVDRHGHLPYEDERPVVGWLEVATLLEPARFEATRQRLEALAQVDNRLDLEAGLQEEARRWLQLCADWKCVAGGAAHERLRPLSRQDARLARLLEQGLEQAPDLPRPSVDGPFSDAGRDGDRAPRTDEEQWAAWSARESEEILGPRGGLASLLGDSFESRQGQVDMALRVERVLRRGEHLMIEAGTGIGKTLAYLVPALLHAGREGQRVVISTHTKALQSQLIDHDLPLLERLGFPGPARLLLGRNNYLCRRQLLRALRHEPTTAAQARAQLALALWSWQSREGRREELVDHPCFERFWRAYFESVEPCSPHICQRHPVCFVVRARRIAREAPVVVVNHALLMMDLKSAQNLMGPARLLVVDEAHHLSDVATRALSHRLSPTRLDVYRNLAGDRHRPRQMREVFEHLVRVSAGSDEQEEFVSAAQAADRQLEAWNEAFVRWFRALESMAAERLGRGHDRPGSHRYHDAAETFGPVRELSDALEEAGDQLHRRLARVVALSAELAEEDAGVEEEREGLAALLEFHRDFREQLAFCLAADDEDWVYWFEWGGSSGLEAVVAAPLTVEEPLAELWDTHYDSVVMTSATLAVETNFLPFAESVGFSRVRRYTDSLQVPSPFQHERQALILTSLDLREPNDPGFAAQVASVVAQIATTVETKTLVLSTSYRFVDQLHEELIERIGTDDAELFHGGGPRVRPEILVQRPQVGRATLVDRFRRADAAVLLATGTFWEGVDFPGRQLELLVVPRLPFAVPTEPVTEGRHERAKRLGRDPFQDVSLVDAVLRLKQGVGRLLRSNDDRGVVLLLDHRLQSKSYGVTFLKSMPRLCDLVPTLEEVGERVIDFLREDPSRARAGRG